MLGFVLHPEAALVTHLIHGPFLEAMWGVLPTLPNRPARLSFSALLPDRPPWLSCLAGRVHTVPPLLGVPYPAVPAVWAECARMHRHTWLMPPVGWGVGDASCPQQPSQRGCG